MPPIFQRRVYPILEYCGPFVRHTTVNARNSRVGSGYGVELLVDIIRNSGGSVLASRGFYSGYRLHSAVRLSHASYATAAAVEKGFVDTSIPADVVVQPSLSSLELVDVTEPLSALEVELIDENEALSHVSDLEAMLRCLRDWGLTDEELGKLRLHVPSSVRSALFKNSAKILVEVAKFLVKECGVPKLKVADALLGNVFLASSRIDDCLRPKVEGKTLEEENVDVEDDANGLEAEADDDEPAEGIELVTAYPWEGSDRDYKYDELQGRVFNILRENNPELSAKRRRTYVVFLSNQ